jgi:diguanylate cyclase (GGDEF)-like protein/PAS domain S-box-containing protein
MAVISTNGRFQRVNRALCELTGYPRDELVGKTFGEITHPDDVDANLDALGDLIEGERYGYRTEKRYIHADGHALWVSLNLSPIYDGEDGAPSYLIAQIEDVSDRKESEERLTRQALHDSLTGLPNRTLFSDRVRMASARRGIRGCAIIYLDLDGFKLVNDTHGHRAGDEVLKQVAKRIQAEIREGDFVGRLGGDEFVIGIEDVTDERATIALAQRLIGSVSEPILLEENVVAHVGASIGVAVGRGGDTNAEGLLNEADLAVYEAKAAGRGRYELFDGSARAALRRRNDLERALAHAIALDELVLHYQPIVDTFTSEVVCYEALVRWNRPGIGLVPPGDFLPTAESSDLICNLDVWVLDAALAQLAEWNRQRGDRSLQVSVNLSGRHIVQRRVLDDVAGALAFADVDPGQLVIEVTETVITDGSLATPHLETLRETGVVISLDDFGTGYTSNSQLSRLPVDILKIDRQFLNFDDEQTRSLCELTVKVGHAFGVRVVAEGIEHQEQLDIVRQLGCEYAQGFFIARPAAAAELPGAAEALAG